MILEACVDSLAAAVNAEKSGAHRLELCADLQHDGLSPSFDMIRQVQQGVNIPIKVMVRPRKGNFVYSNDEIDEMIAFSKKCYHMGITSIVTGMLTEKNEIHLPHLERLASSIPEMDITFHKAIDLTTDPINEIKKILHISNVKSILTSGKAITAAEGKNLIKEMMSIFYPRLTIIAAGKITYENIHALHKSLNGTDYHGKKIVG